jgi:hypothetical protein
MPYIAIAPLRPPGSLVAGYQPGDEVTEQVKTDWDLDDTQVRWVDADEDGRPIVPADVAVPVVRPGPEANRATWEAYAVSNGMSEQDAADASMDDLQASGPDQGEQADPNRPADSALKADWLAYVKGQGADADWADTATKADLMAWQPAVGDTVAVAASDAQA